MKLDSLMFPIADTLQVPLSLTTNVVTSKLNREMPLGPWKLKFNGEVRSLEVDSKRVGVIAHLRKDLYLLLVCRNEGREMYAVLFDGKLAGVKNCTIPGSVKDAYAKIKAAAVRTLQYNNPQQKWRPLNAVNLD